MPKTKQGSLEKPEKLPEGERKHGKQDMRVRFPRGAEVLMITKLYSNNTLTPLKCFKIKKCTQPRPLHLCGHLPFNSTRDSAGKTRRKGLGFTGLLWHTPRTDE